MVFTNVGRSGTAILLTGSYVIPNGIEVGTGSSSKSVSSTSLVTPWRFATFTTTDTTTIRFITYTADFNSVQMSGATVREFGVKTSGGALWSVEGIPAVTFDGTNELQVQVTWEVY